jgi:predicted hydrolase (HD superfamily)
MDLKGVKKRLKEKSFAANVSREDIQDAANRCGVALDEIIQFVVVHQTLLGV